MNTINETPLLTIIIPCYNASNFLSKCLDSIYSQDVHISFFEVICVDDCSSDNTCDIITDYKKEYSNINLVKHLENKKAGGSRNSGLNLAIGRFVWFIDADDYICAGALSKISKVIEDITLDMVLFNFDIVDSEGIFVKMDATFPATSTVVNGIEYLKQNFHNGFAPYLGYAWRGVYKRELLIDIGLVFPENISYGEDTTHMCSAIIQSKKVLSLGYSVYCYRQNPYSHTYQLNEKKSGEFIFQSFFIAGNLIQELSFEVKQADSTLSALIIKDLSWFVNRMFIKVLRATPAERKEFYFHLNNNEKLIKSIYPYFDLKNKLLINLRFVSTAFSDILSMLYKKYKTIND